MKKAAPNRRGLILNDLIKKSGVVPVVGEGRAETSAFILRACATPDIGAGCADDGRTKKNGEKLTNHELPLWVFWTKDHSGINGNAHKGGDANLNS